MLTIPQETLCFIVAKAREFQAKEEVVIPESLPDSPSENWARQVLADHTDDHTFQEVAVAVADLDARQQAELVALMWLGRGDYALEEWETAVAAAQDMRSDHPAAYLLAHPLLAFYLDEGMARHGYACDT